MFRKGTDPTIDSYSGFYDNGHLQQTGLGDYLRERGTTTVSICGLATDYCVKFTALDAVAEGFKTHLVADACRGVELNNGDVAAAVEEMRQAGVVITDSKKLESSKKPECSKQRSAAGFMYVMIPRLLQQRKGRVGLACSSQSVLLADIHNSAPTTGNGSTRCSNAPTCKYLLFFL